jgi:general secretion pathway protein G
MPGPDLSALRVAARRRDAGARFTLIELVVTLALVGIVALAVLPFSELIVQRQKEQEPALPCGRSERRWMRTRRPATSAPSRRRQICPAIRQRSTCWLLASSMPRTRRAGCCSFCGGCRAIRSMWAMSMCHQSTWNVRAYGKAPDGSQAGSADVYDVSSTSTRVGLNGIPYKDW